MFTARKKEIQLYPTWRFQSIFPAPSPSQGARSCLSLPLPIPRSSPLPWLPRVGANRVWDGDACQLGIELRAPYASEQLSDGNDFLPLVLISPATERAFIVRSFWSHPTPTEVTLCLFHNSWSLLESEGPLAARTADTILYLHTERAEPGSAELTWNARLRARGAGQVPGKINSTEPPGGGGMLAPSLYRCSLPSDLWLYVGICSKGRALLALPPAGKKVTRICSGDSRQDQIQRVTGRL